MESSRGTWVAQLVKCPISAQVMFSVCGFEPRVRLCADSQSLESALDSVSPSAPPLLILSLSLSLKNK